MYTNFRIQNFRGFKDLELKDLARVNLIAGKNNVGKTSLLEAILTHAGDDHILLDRTRFRRSPARQTQPARIELEEDLNALKVLFYHLDIRQDILFSGDHTVRPAQPSLFEEFNRKIVDGKIEISVERIENVDRGLLLSRGEISSLESIGLLLKSSGNEVAFIGKRRYGQNILLPPAAFIKSYINVPSRTNARIFSNLKISKDIDTLITPLQLIEPRLKNLELVDDGIYADIGLSALIPVNSLGEGLGRLMTIILAISDARNGIVAIDEIENGLHYSVQTDVWKAIAEAAKQFNVQIFATTHSREMIQAAYEAFKETPEDDFRFHRLDRDRTTGDIYPTTYDQYSIEAAMDVNAEVR